MEIENMEKSELYPQWYIITVVSGNEDSVIKNLKGKIKAHEMWDLIQDIKVIKDTLVEEEIFIEDDLPSSYGRKLKNVVWTTFKAPNGKTKFKKTKTTEINRFYGYIFIKMIMTEDAWFIIRNTPLITGIVGSSGKNTKPIPVSDFEIEAILNYDKNKEDVVIKDDEIIEVHEDAIIAKKIKHKAHFLIGNTVIINHNNISQKGLITFIDENKGLALVDIEFFGRTTQMEVPFANIELDN